MPKSTIDEVLLLIISLLWMFGVLEGQELKDRLRQIGQETEDGKAEEHGNSEKCGGEFEGSSGTLDYYFENGTYPFLASCSWSITVPMGSVINITFIKFETEREYDYLYVVEGGTILLEASGGTKPDQVISSTSKVKVKFTSDWVFSLSGFTLNWEAKDSSSGSFPHLMAICPPVLPTVTCPPPPAPVTCPPPTAPVTCPPPTAPVTCPPPTAPVTCPPPIAPVTCPPPTAPVTCPPPTGQVKYPLPTASVTYPPPPTPTSPPTAACPEITEVLALDNRSQDGFHKVITNVIEEHCLDPWVFLEVTGECILNSKEILIADSAEAACKNLCARLIIPKDTAELAKCMNQYEWIGDYYVGANDKGSPGHYHWHNGTHFPDEAFWEDFPKDGEPGNSCVVINYYYGKEKLIASKLTNCEKDKWRDICQK